MKPVANTMLVLLLWSPSVAEEVPDARILKPLSGDFQKLIVTVQRDDAGLQKTLCLSIDTNNHNSSCMRIDLHDRTYVVEGIDAEPSEARLPLDDDSVRHWLTSLGVAGDAVGGESADIVSLVEGLASDGTLDIAQTLSHFRCFKVFSTHQSLGIRELVACVILVTLLLVYLYVVTIRRGKRSCRSGDTTNE